MVKELPIVINADKDLFCFFDERLKELRDIYNPFNAFRLNEFELEYYRDLVKKGKTFNKAIRQQDEGCEVV